ncbi:MAG: SDR family NAD(P)-dependent oxidoreductase [Calditrichaeota bacterium]|nr:MAG: SDR family NAD(P)-dependent oxidoreductase [Calditrichota bacterium]
MPTIRARCFMLWFLLDCSFSPGRRQSLYQHRNPFILRALDSPRPGRCVKSFHSRARCRPELLWNGFSFCPRQGKFTGPLPGGFLRCGSGAKQVSGKANYRMGSMANHSQQLPGAVQAFWQGKALFLTGASSGLGRAVVEALAPLGVHFGLVSRREALLAELSDRLADTGSRFWYRAVDVRDRDALYRAVADFHRQAGRLDVVWANSGVGAKTSWRSWDWDAVETCLDVNLKGAIYTIRAGLEVMRPQGQGTVVATGSAASMRGLPGSGIYCTTKIGLHYFVESLAAEMPEIRFCILHPGFVDTPINQDMPNRPWLMTPQKAARLMLTAVARGRFIYIYPFQMRLLYRLVRALPSRLYLWGSHRTVSRASREKPEKQNQLS